MPTWKRVKVALVFCLWYLWGYVAVQRFVHLMGFQAAVLTLPGEENIPFIPEMFFIYCAIYLMPIGLFGLLRDSPHFRVTLEVFTLASLVHFFAFIVFPVHYELRPELAGHGTQSLAASIAYFYTLDGTTNCFPSMHVSFAFLSYFCIRKYRPKWATTFLVMATAVSLSTLLVKQHYVLDVVSAFVLAGFLNFLLPKRAPLSGR